MTTIETALQTASERLRDHSDSPRLDAELLLAQILEADRTHLRTWPEQELTTQQQSAFERLLERRLAGEPVAYLLGRRGFWTFELEVTPDTLIPRPETELLVEQALARIPEDAAWPIADLGTGSGAIALAIASERPACTVHATDRSAAALDVARRNAKALGLDNVRFHQGVWFQALPKAMAWPLIVSNPPYVPDTAPHLDARGVRFEPRQALAAGADGLDDIRHLVDAARPRLVPGGWLLLEHGWDQGEAVARLLEAAGYTAIAGYRDLAGHPRVSAGRRPANPED